MADERDEQAFDELLATPSYERLRARLVRLFARRGCANPADLADETVARVVAKLDSVRPGYRGAPARYVFAVARNVFREQLREPRFEPLDESANGRRTLEAFVGARGRNRTGDCLESCLGTLDEADRRLVTGYYGYGVSKKSAHRERLASDAGLQIGAVRLRVFRIRRRLGECIEACLEKKALAGEMKPGGSA